MSEQSYERAMQDFRRARQEAALRQILQRFSGRSEQLLAYNDLSEKLAITDTVERGLQEIPLKAIVGSVGRAEDFTRDFLPKRDSDAERWASVKVAVLDMKGWPPIDVYQVGNAYFVKDGNHRVSVARQLGNETISAIVTEIETSVPIDGADDPETILDRASYANFLARTGLDQVRPQADLHLTFCDQYETLINQIEQYRQRLAGEGQDFSESTAAAAWYDDVYLPLVDLIRAQGVMRNFQGQTEADMYVLLSERRAELEEALGWQLKPESAVSAWAGSIAESRPSVLARLGGKLRGALAPGLEAGPSPGEWRRRRRTAGTRGSLFNDILVSLQGTAADWQLLDNTLLVARREEATIMAIHAVADESEIESSTTHEIEAEFHRRCHSAGVAGQFAAEAGVEGKLLIGRSPWVDLITTNLTFATDFKSAGPLGSGVDQLIQRSPRPILVMSGEEPAPLNRALLAYDGSPKADEALFVAAYLAARWGIHLSVVTVVTEYTPPQTLDRARAYLIGRSLIHVNYVLGQKPILETVLATAEAQDSNLLIVGGFGYRPLRHVVLGSTVDGVLSHSTIPTLICR